VGTSIIVGDRCGDESEVFVIFIDALIRFGGGPQSRRGVALFKDRSKDAPDLTERLIEVEG